MANGKAGISKTEAEAKAKTKSKPTKRKANRPPTAYQAARLARDIGTLVTAVKTRDPAPVIRRVVNKAIGREVVSKMYVKSDRPDWLQIAYNVVGFVIFRARK